MRIHLSIHLSIHPTYLSIHLFNHPSTHLPIIYQVIVTTYDTVKHGGLSSELRMMCFRCVFLDEGHRIRNEDAGMLCYAMLGQTLHRC